MKRLQTALANKDNDTIDGQLCIANAWADCGQLIQARKLFDELLTLHDDVRIHKAFEEFLAKKEKDIKQAEDHFGQRRKYFCLPKTFLQTTPGQDLINQGRNRRIQYLTKRMKELSNLGVSAAFNIEYKNNESLWDYHLFFIDPKYLVQSREVFVKWMKEQSPFSLYHF